MAEYYARNPQYKTVQEGRVESGYRVLSGFGIQAEDIEAMSMDEFKKVMADAITSIPHDVTRPYDEEIINISDAGWENMKKDPDYAAWALGYIKADRSVKNPFFGMGDMGAYDIRNIGASPEEYSGQMFSKVYGGTAAGARSRFNAGRTGNSISYKSSQADLQPPADYNLWEERRKARNKRQKELLESEIQAKFMQRKRINEMHENRYFEQQRLMKAFGFNSSNRAFHSSHAGSSVSASTAISMYESSLSLDGADGIL